MVVVIYDKIPVMIIVVLILLGLCLGSLVNAVIWRLHQQEKEASPRDAKSKAKLLLAKDNLSILTGRSMCPHCRHQLAAKDLVPVLSWLSLGGKCRYCHKPIGWQYPIVEVKLALLFILSYYYWPYELHGAEWSVFGAWLLCLTLLVALAIYDYFWLLLPDKLLKPLVILTLVYAVIPELVTTDRTNNLLHPLVGALVIAGLFYILFTISGGKWLGFGDVKLAVPLGLLAGTAGQSLLLIFTASILGSLVAIPLLVLKKTKMSSKLPFGPFLIAATIVVVLFGPSFSHWYTATYLGF